MQGMRDNRALLRGLKGGGEKGGRAAFTLMPFFFVSCGGNGCKGCVRDGYGEEVFGVDMNLSEYCRVE